MKPLSPSSATTNVPVNKLSEFAGPVPFKETKIEVSGTHAINHRIAGGLKGDRS
jgi:hypothetical protein